MAFTVKWGADGRPFIVCDNAAEAFEMAKLARMDHLYEDSMIAHRWFAEQFGEVMNGRNFAVKCPMATELLKTKLAALEPNVAGGNDPSTRSTVGIAEYLEIAEDALRVYRRADNWKRSRPDGPLDLWDCTDQENWHGPDCANRALVEIRRLQVGVAGATDPAIQSTEDPRKQDSGTEGQPVRNGAAEEP